MDKRKPSTEAIDKLVQDIRVHDAVDSRIQREGEEEDVCEVAEAGRQARDHVACTHCFDDEDVGHYREDVVVRGEGR